MQIASVYTLQTISDIDRIKIDCFEEYCVNTE